MSRGLWRNRSAESGVSQKLCSKEGKRMKHLRAINRKAHLIDDFVESAKEDVVALGFQGPQQPRLGMHVPMGCSFVFTPGWAVAWVGVNVRLCQPIMSDM